MLNRISSPDPSPATSPFALYLVPSRDLAFQIHEWALRLLKHLPASVKTPEIGLAVRGPETGTLPTSPFLLIATANRLLELLAEGTSPLLKNTQMLVLDEADGLFQWPKRYTDQKQRKALARHPTSTEILLQEHIAPLNSRFVFLAAATLSREFRMQWFRHGWLPPSLFSSDDQQAKKQYLTLSTTFLIENPLVRHYGVVVGNDSVWHATDKSPTADRTSSGGNTSAIKETPGKKQNNASKNKQNSNEEEEELPVLLTAVAQICQKERLKDALIFIPNTASQARAASFLSSLGLTGVCLKTPTVNSGLIVSSHAAARGLDLPGLQYVFLVGLPVDSVAYLHMSGRVGRLRGKIDGVNNEKQDNTGNVFCIVPANQERGLLGLWKGLKIKPNNYEGIVKRDNIFN